MKIPIYRPSLPSYALVEPDIRAMYSSEMLYPGVFTERLAEEVTNFCGVKYVLPAASCSLGLIILLNTITKGSKVIMPAFTFNATLQALEWNGLVPVIVDVDDDGQMPSELVQECLNDHPHDVEAILPVHMWGNLCNTDEYDELSMNTGVPIFYDGAHALGSFENQTINAGAATVFSIAVTKPISAGEGGLIVTNDGGLYLSLRDSVFHGLYNSLDTRVRGINGKIQEFNSIIAYHAIKCFSDNHARRQELMEYYRNNFKDLSIRICKTRKGVDSVYKDCIIFAETEGVRNDLDAFLQGKGIGTKRYFEPAIPDMGSFVGIVHSADNARRLAATCLTIPLYPSLTDNEIEYIVKTIKKFYE